MSGHNEAYIGQISRGQWTVLNATADLTSTLTTEWLLRSPCINIQGTATYALTLPDLAQSDLSGYLFWVTYQGTGALTIEASANFGGLAGTSTLTITQGGLAPILCGSAYYYTMTSATTLS